MKVMIVGGNQMKYVASRYYAYANKLSNGFIRNNHTVIQFFDRDVARLGNVLRSRTFGVAGANRKLLQQAASFQPDLILLVHADVIRPETVEQLKESRPAAKIAQISVDALFVRTAVERLNTKNHLMDATFMTTAGAGLRKVSDGQPAYYTRLTPKPEIPCGR